MELISREIACERGLKRYFTGEACRYGHVAERLTSTTRCTECLKEYKEENKEREKAYQEQWKKDNQFRLAEAREKRKESKRQEKIKALPEKKLAAKQKRQELDRKYRNRNKEKRKQLYMIYYASSNGRAVYRTNASKRRALIEDIPGEHISTDILFLGYLQNGCCMVCYESIIDGYHVDHVTPVSKEGSNFPENLQLLCARCNLSKNDKLMEVWLTDETEYQEWSTRRFLFLVALLLRGDL